MSRLTATARANKATAKTAAGHGQLATEKTTPNAITTRRPTARTSLTGERVLLDGLGQKARGPHLLALAARAYPDEKQGAGKIVFRIEL